MYPPPINHRSIECHYTKYIYIYSRMHIYLGQMYPLQLTIDVWHTATPSKIHI